ncbi:MAG: mercuric transporter MerT family protein [Phycisphaerae bacterium]
MNTQNKFNNGGENCCTPKTGLPDTNQGQKAPKTWSAGAVAIAAAILASACCWLPLALLALGVSAAGLSKFIVGARWVFVAIAVAALGLGFYFSSRRTATCAPGEACAPSGLARFNRVMLWVSAVLVLAFATFPYYSAPLLQAVSQRGSHASAHSNPPPQTVIKSSSSTNVATNTTDAAITQFRLYAYQIKGMDCQECADGLQAAIAKLPGVKKATVSYQQGTAQVRAAAGFDPQSVAKRISGIGYKTTQIPPAKPATACCP